MHIFYAICSLWPTRFPPLWTTLKGCHTATSKTVAMSKLDVACEAHHKHPWSYGHSKSAIPCLNTASLSMDLFALTHWPFSYLEHKKKMDSWEHLEWSHGRYVCNPKPCMYHSLYQNILVAMHMCLVDLHCLKSVSAVCKQVIDPHSSAPSDSTMFSTPPIHTTTT